MMAGTERAGTMTEAQLMHGLIQCARSLGFLCYHATDARRSEPGFPDLLIVGHGHVIAWECKAQRGRLRSSSVTKRGRHLPGQAEWLEAFDRAAIAGVVRPQSTEDALGYDAALDVLRMIAGQYGRAA